MAVNLKFREKAQVISESRIKELEQEIIRVKAELGPTCIKVSYTFLDNTNCRFSFSSEQRRATEKSGAPSQD